MTRMLLRELAHRDFPHGRSQRRNVRHALRRPTLRQRFLRRSVKTHRVPIHRVRQSNRCQQNGTADPADGHWCECYSVSRRHSGRQFLITTWGRSEDSVSGETGQTYTTYTVNGAASVAAPTTTTPGAVAMNGTGIMSSTTSGATASAMTPTAGSMNVSSSTNSSAEALSGVLLADPSGSSASTAAVVTSPVRGEKSCSRSRKRGL